MVKKFLKIAGVKSEAEFYKKYPSEAAFFKAHPEARELKQYRQGGQQKKLNQLIDFQGDVDNIMPIAQTGVNMRDRFDFMNTKDLYARPAAESTAITYRTPSGQKSTATAGQTKSQTADVVKGVSSRGKANKVKRIKKIKENEESNAAIAAKDRGEPFILPSGQEKLYSDMSAAEQAYVSGAALKNRFKFFPDDPFSAVDEFNPFSGIVGKMAGNLGQAPLQAMESNSIAPVLGAVADPMLTGAIFNYFSPGKSSLKILDPTLQAKDIYKAGANTLKGDIGAAAQKHLIKMGTKASKKALVPMIAGKKVSPFIQKPNESVDRETLDILSRAGSRANNNQYKFGRNNLQMGGSLSDNSGIGDYIGGDIEDLRNIQSYDTYRDQVMNMNAAEQAKKDAQLEQLQSTFQNLGKKAKKGTKVPKLQNAQYYPILGANQTNDYVGASAPAGGTMTLAPQAAQANANMQNTLWGTGQTISQGPVAGGVTPSSVAGVNMTMGGGGGGFDLLGALGGAQGIGNLVGGVVGGIRNIRNAKQATKDAEAQAKISELSLQAAKSRPEETRRRYVRPEDSLVQPEQLFPSYGVGTNYLARNGSILRAQNGVDESYEKLKEYGSAAYDQMAPFYKTLYEAANKYENPETGKTSPLNSLRASAKAFIKHPEVMFMKRHNLPEEIANESQNPYGVEGFTTATPGGGLRDWYPTQWGEPVKGLGIGKFFGDIGEDIGDFFENRKIRRQTRRGMRKQSNCFYGKCYDEEGNVTPEAEDGMQIGGNLTEIQNMYNPGDLYDDLGYEPLGESDVIKQYQGGGMLGVLGGGSATTPGVGGMTGADFGNIGTGLFNAAYGASPESQLGGQIGSVFGPVGSIAGTMIGKIAGSKREGRMHRAQMQTKANTQALMGQAFGQGIQGQFGSHMKDGGWVSHDWLPQKIVKFGEHYVSDLLRKDPTMDNLRTGGNIRQNQMFPQDQFNLGGELKTTWGGYAESMSRNPYLPGTGETVMFRGKSHDESDGKGRTGIGVKYGGEDGEYSPYMEYGRDGVEDVTDVEVERGEPAMEMMDGSGDKSMVVFGNLKIPNKFLDEIGDPSAKGKKFKNYVKDLSKKEARQNKIIDRATQDIDNLDIRTQFDQLQLQGLKAMLTGADMKLKDIAQKKMNASAVQNAINETAEEMGVDADALAKGKVKMDKEAQKQMAKFGKKIPKAQGGMFTIDPDVIARSMENLSNFVRDAYWNLTEPAAQTQPVKKPAASAKPVQSSPWSVGDTYRAIDQARNTPSASTPKVSATKPAAAKSKKAAAKPATKPATASSSSSSEQTYSSTPTTSERLPALKQEDYEYLKKLYDEAKAQGRGDKVLKFQKEYHRLAPDFAKRVIGREALTTYGKKKGLTTADLTSNEDEIFGPRTEQYMAQLDNSPRYKGKIVAPTPEEGTPEQDKSKIKIIPPDVEPLEPSPVIDIVNQILPYFRPTDQEEFDYSQIYPEMMALASNQLEPVPAQLYQPQLLTPYDVSYQDQLNEVNAQTRAAERIVGNNPAALASIAAEANRTKSSILGEQFRQNQAQRMGVYNQNIGAINDAKLRNLAILDQQMVRQEEGKSRTKAQNLEAVKSISDKIAKNKLENRTLGIYENLYNYRFDESGRAQNWNPLAQFNTALGGSGTSESAPEGYEYETVLKKKKKKDEDTGRNGRIVKAIKGL